MDPPQAAVLALRCRDWKCLDIFIDYDTNMRLKLWLTSPSELESIVSLLDQKTRLGEYLLTAVQVESLVRVAPFVKGKPAEPLLRFVKSATFNECVSRFANELVVAWQKEQASMSSRAVVPSALRSPLHIAGLHGGDSFQLLCEVGFDVNVLDANDATPLQYFLEYGRTPLIDEFFAETELVSKINWSLTHSQLYIHFAAARLSPRAVSTIFKNIPYSATSADALDADGCPPIRYAVSGYLHAVSKSAKNDEIQVNRLLKRVLEIIDVLEYAGATINKTFPWPVLNKSMCDIFDMAVIQGEKDGFKLATALLLKFGSRFGWQLVQSHE
jgi:hypothetical protein